MRLEKKGVMASVMSISCEAIGDYGLSSGDHLEELCTGEPGHADDRRVVGLGFGSTSAG